MVRALILLAAALVVAALPLPRLLRVVVVSVLVVAAGVVGFLVEEQEAARQETRRSAAADESARWEPPGAGEVRVVDFNTLSPLRFPEHWVVDVVANVESRGAAALTGIEVTAIARDCPDGAAAAADCTTLGESSDSETFAPIRNPFVRRVPLRFDFRAIPYPTGVLRLEPRVTSVRRGD